jgi:hypothetical protein
MPITTSANANEILNRVAVEVGLDPVADPYSTEDSAFIQLRFLINSVGVDLSLLHDWNFLVK